MYAAAYDWSSFIDLSIWQQSIDQVPPPLPNLVGLVVHSNLLFCLITVFCPIDDVVSMLTFNILLHTRWVVQSRQPPHLTSLP